MLITALKVPIVLVPSEKEQDNLEKLISRTSLLILFSSQCFISYMFFGTTA